MAEEVIYSEFQAERLAEAGIPVRMNDDLKFVIPPLECWPKEAFEVEGANTFEVTKGVYRVLLGDETWEAFEAAGGTAAGLDKIVELKVDGGKAGTRKRGK